MAYVGKYFDRNPCLKTAGVASKQTGTARDSLKIYSDEEAAEEVIKTKCRYQRQEIKDVYFPRSPFIPEGNIKDILSTELKKSRFVAFREKFSEDMFFQKPELGKVYPLHSKPDDVNNENTTFGDPIIRSESVYELVLPPKSPDEVNREFVQWHDKYIVSHKHYFPSEQINRHYDRKYFDPANTFGGTVNADITGKNVKKCLTQCDRLIIINKAQKDFLDKSLGKLGTRNKRREYNIPEDLALGLTTPKDKCDVKALIENIDPCIKKTKLLESISHINKLRRNLFSRINFHMHDLKSAMERRDYEKSGFLPFSHIFEAARSLLIRMDEEKIRTVAKLFGLVVDEGQCTERMDYEQFLKILQIQYPLPKTGNISTMPDNIYNKDTTYRELCRDMNKKPEEIKFKAKTFEKTSTKDLISPDIPLQFGLDQSDFDIPRSKKVLHKIFKQIITDDIRFDEIWEQTRLKFNPANKLISVNELRLVMNELSHR